MRGAVDLENTVRRWGNPETILVATNLIEGPGPMLHAVNQAKLSGAKVLLVHVIRPSALRSNANSGLLTLPHPRLRLIKATLDQMAKAFQREGILCEPMILRGVPADQIRLLIQTREVDRVIVAARHPRGVDRLLIGSLAEELAGTLDVPVCIVGHGARGEFANANSPRHILVASSLRDSSSLCVAFACAFAERHHAAITLLHVLESPRMTALQRAQARSAAEQALMAEVSPAARDACRVVVQVLAGDPSAEILHFATAARFDFIVLGSPPDSIVSRILGSSIIHNVVSEANCPVITVKPPEPLMRIEPHAFLAAGQAPETSGSTALKFR